MMTNNEGNFYSDNTGATSNEQYWAAINFWFADTLDGGDIGAQNKIWFGASATTDATLRRLFGDQVRQAIAGDLHHWCQQPVSTMALVLLLDQFTRNIFRGDARAFSGDELACSTVKQAIAAGVDRQLPILYRTFFYMPLEHSESLADQQQCVDLFEQLLAAADSSAAAMVASSLSYAKKHRTVIAQFGRFPHRNCALQRQSTAAELAYLTAGGARFGQ